MLKGDLDFFVFFVSGPEEASIFRGWDLAKWLERLTANVTVTAVLSSIQASFDTVESEQRQMKQCE